MHAVEIDALKTIATLFAQLQSASRPRNDCAICRHDI
jgi:hypothetical protein